MKKTQPIHHLHAGSELSPHFFDGSSNKKLGIFAFVFVLRWEDYFRRSARWRQRYVAKTGRFWSNERSYRGNKCLVTSDWWIFGCYFLVAVLKFPKGTFVVFICIKGWDDGLDDAGRSGCWNTWSLDRIDCPPSTGKGGGEEKSPPRISHFQPSACNHGWSTYPHPNVPPPRNKGWIRLY